jgi:hypothetical protein
MEFKKEIFTMWEVGEFYGFKSAQQLGLLITLLALLHTTVID